ncbi:hypothetical protein C1645_811555 [Glomus cerebriforme]|uniref:F-box domain-containing protein n=1 Tax=Glomus cerebriforme TaxID=658196 RepID=A0A397TVY6_9GLOM|nr:hypothetical protein C1645_811555 [Glomus cerebriforme]
MASSVLPVECLSIIFEHLSYERMGVKNYSFTILHSCILVNKSWCVTAIPILWRNAWNWLIDGLYLNRLSLLTATFITCLPKEIKNSLIRNHIKLKKWMKKVPSFEYSYFMNSLDYSWLYFSVNIFLKEHLKNKKENDKNEYRLMVIKELCKLFMKSSKNLIQLNYENQYQKRYNYYKIRVEDYINLIFLPEANQTLKNLKKFQISGWIPSEIIFGISKICKNIEEIKINDFHMDDDNDDVLIILIQEQKFLKKFSFEIKLKEEEEDDDNDDDKILFLKFEKILKLKLQKFQSLTLSPICFCMDIFTECYNLEELNLIDERQFNEEILEKFSKTKFLKLLKLNININFLSFKQISSLIRNTEYNLEIITMIWIEGVDEIENFQKFIDSIIFYCPNLKEYHGNFDINSIPLLCKNCIHLKKLGFYNFNIIDFSEILKQVGDVIPINLSNFYLPLCWNFNSESLEYFLEKCLIRLRYPLYFNIYEREKHSKIIKHFSELNVLKKDDY